MQRVRWEYVQDFVELVTSNRFSRNFNIFSKSAIVMVAQRGAVGAHVLFTVWQYLHTPQGITMYVPRGRRWRVCCLCAHSRRGTTEFVA